MDSMESAVVDIHAALTGKLSMDRVTQNTAVTQAGYAADARQLNASMEGTFANRAEQEIGSIKKSFYSLNLEDSILLPYGADLNVAAYRKPGNYHCNDISVVNSLVNCPVRDALFTMKVEFIGDVYFPCQTIRVYSSGYIYYRWHSSTDWDVWKVIRTESVS